MADYGAPKPIDPVCYQRDAVLRVRCACGHRMNAKLGPFCKAHGVSDDTCCYQLIARLKCSKCGARPVAADVVRHSHLHLSLV